MAQCLLFAFVFAAFACAANAQDIKVEGDADYLPAIKASFDSLARDFEQGELIAKIKYQSATAKLRLVWRGEEAIWYVEESHFDQLASHEPDSTKTTELVIAKSKTEIVFHYPERAVAQIFPSTAKGLIPKYLHVVPSDFWQSGHPDFPSWSKVFSAASKSGIVTRMGIERSGREINFTRHLSDGSEVTMVFQMDEAIRLTRVMHPRSKSDWLRNNSEFRWEKLDNGAAYLAEVKFWFTRGEEPFPQNPAYVYQCESISQADQVDTHFDLKGLKLPEGTKLEHYGSNGTVVRTDYIGSKLKHEELVIRRAALLNRRRGISVREASK